jgi:hypothetical protein
MKKVQQLELMQRHLSTDVRPEPNGKTSATNEYFLKHSNIVSLPSVHAQMFFYKILGCLLKEKNKYKVSACFFENTY